MLTRIRERDLLSRAKAGDRRAADDLVKAFTPLATSFAKRRGKFGVPYEDLVQEGLMGIARAIEKFDLDNTNGFATYARWWVRAQIDAYTCRNWSVVNHGGIQRIPKLYKVIGAIGMDTSLSAPISVTHHAAKETLLPDRRPLPDETAIEAQRSALTAKALGCIFGRLSVRERDVMRRRWLCDESETLETISTEYGLSRERIRQIEVTALTKIGVAHLLRHQKPNAVTGERRR